MYRIYANDMLIYDDTRMEDTLRLVSPKLTLEDNAAGSLMITVPPGNAGYDSIEQLNTTIRVEKDGDEIWEGRVLQERKDFWNDRVLTCEGELAYLNDVILPQEKKTYSRAAYGGSVVIKEALEWILTSYNAKVDDSKKFYIGAVTVSKPVGDLELFTDYEDASTLIRSKLINEFGGHLKIRKEVENGVKTRYIDYKSDASLQTNSQVIEFGKNLEDFTSSLDASDFATVVLPLGKKKTDRSENSEVEEYVMLTDASPALVDTDILDSIYVKAHTPVDGESPLTTYGRIERVLKFDNEEDPQNLLLMAKDYLTNIQYQDLVLELTALDLHYLNPDIESVKICDIIRVKSAPHNLDKEFIVQKLEIPLDSPENAKITLGGTVRVSMTSSTNKVNTQLKEQAERAPSIDKDAIIEAVDQNVSAIMNQKTQGYVTILTDDTGGTHSEALYISAQKYNSGGNTPFGQRYWKWFSDGLGYTENGGTTWKTAITMDGTIKGEYIAAGTIHGSKITAGSLSLVTSSGDGYCDLSLKSNGFDQSDLEIGTITNGMNVNEANTTYVRSRFKVPLSSGQKIKVTDYSYSVVQYTDKETSTSGYSQTYGSYNASHEFTVPATGYYRLKINYGQIVSQNDLATIASKITMGDGLVISAGHITFTGIVKFTDLETSNSYTKIHGGNIITGTISADEIDTSTLKVNTVWYHDAYETDSQTGHEFKMLYADMGQSNTIIYFGAKELSRVGSHKMIHYGSEFQFRPNNSGTSNNNVYTLFIDTSNRVVEGNKSSTNWTLGSSGNPFDLYADNIYGSSAVNIQNQAIFFGDVFVGGTGQSDPVRDLYVSGNLTVEGTINGSGGGGSDIFERVRFYIYNWPTIADSGCYLFVNEHGELIYYNGSSNIFIA